MIRLMLGMIAAWTLLAAGAAAQERTAAPDSARMQVLALIRAGDDAAALEACRRYTSAHAHDLVMRYNQACLEARSGLLEEAVATLRGAVRDGYDDLAHIESDPDLAPLAADPRFSSLLTEIRSRLVLAAAEGGLVLSPGAAQGFFLRSAVPSPISSFPRATLVWRPDALQLRLSEPRGACPPGATRLIVTLGLPDDAEPYLARNFFVFAFGTDSKGAGWGAVWVPTTAHWQPVVELNPHEVARGVPLEVAIPWSLVQPLHPLTDPTLGVNVTVDLRNGPGERWAIMSAVVDPDVLDPAAPARRVVPLAFAADGVAGPAFLGRVTDNVVNGSVLDFELVAVSPRSGAGTLSVDFLDNRGRSLLAGGAETGTLDFATGLQRLPRQASFAGLRTGSYRLQATIGFPGGGDAVWSTTILNLAPGWADSLALRTAALAPLDRRTAEHFFAAVRTAVAEHLPRRHPGPIAKTLGDLDAMLDRAAATGSILPPDGPGLLVYAGPDGTDRLCTFFRPAPGAERGAETPVLVIDDAPGNEDAFAGRFARFYANGDLAGAGARHPLYLIPQLPEEDRETEARAALDFLCRRFAVDAVPVVGVDAGGAIAVRLTAADGRGISGLMVLAGGHVDPWPGAGDAELADRLAGLPGSLPVDWTEFSQVTGPNGAAPRVLRALEATGVRLVSRTAGGGLGLSQAADRIVLWAEDLSLPDGE